MLVDHFIARKHDEAVSIYHLTDSVVIGTALRVLHIHSRGGNVLINVNPCRNKQAFYIPTLWLEPVVP